MLKNSKKLVGFNKYMFIPLLSCIVNIAHDIKEVQFCLLSQQYPIKNHQFPIIRFNTYNHLPQEIPFFFFLFSHFSAIKTLYFISILGPPFFLFGLTRSISKRKTQHFLVKNFSFFHFFNFLVIFSSFISYWAKPQTFKIYQLLS